MEYQQIMTALRNAHAAGDQAAAQRLAQMAREAQARQGGSGVEAAPQDRGFGAMLYDNLIGNPDDGVDSWGEQAGRTTNDVLRSGASGLVRGATELAALPATIGDGLGALYERTGLVPEGSMQNEPSIGAGMRDVVSALTLGGSEYEPQTTAGEYVQTVGEFAGGGAGGRVSVIGGLMSEGAGQMTEGTALEPYARLAGGVAGGLLATPRPTSAPVGNSNSPAGQRALQANQLRDEGINVTMGQQTNSPILRRMEGTLDAPDMQPEQFTSVIMRRLGSNSDIATPQALAAVQDDIVQQMDDAVRGVTVVPMQTHAAAANDISSTYMSNVETGSAVPRVREIAEDIANRATNGQPLDLATVRTLRQDIGNLTVSSNNATRRAAQALRGLLDDMTDMALTNAGRTDDIAKLSDARRSYRDFLAVRDASTRPDASAGVLSPAQLNQSMIRVMDRTNYGVGRTTPTSDFTRAAASIMRSAPTVNSGGLRGLENLPMILGGAGGYAAGGPLGLMAGVAAPVVGQSVMRSPPVQSMMMNPAGTVLSTGQTVPGILAGQQDQQQQEADAVTRALMLSQ